MCIHCAFGFAGGAGGVDRVGEGVGGWWLVASCWWLAARHLPRELRGVKRSRRAQDARVMNNQEEQRIA